MILDALPQSNPLAASSQLDKIVQDLTHDQHKLRIKKLLVYACYHSWESDLSKLEVISLQDLLRTLLDLAPTLENLRSYLENVVNTLNKSAEYTLVANTIVGYVRVFYSEVKQVPSHQADYQTIAQRLGHDQDSLRIKKLLVLACKNIWVSDREELEQLNTIDLVQTLHQQAPTLESLKLTLANRVKKLSKQSEYNLIAERIINIFQSLYTAKELTLVSKNLESTEVVSSVNRPFESTRTESKPQAQASISQMQDLFDLRLELMRYTSPFRVKILLFSLLHEPFKQTIEHDLMLKSHELDDLLRMVFQTYRELTELELSLKNVVRSLGSSDDYSQVAGVLLRVINPFYLCPIIYPQPILERVDRSTRLIRAESKNDEATRPECF
ncbi:MAG: hypothetical protein HC769_20005 [Cyanobacteria bacterium CRU_2_1]|nr:hypothetical protein [Cyanobacteria bacterium CRU_2_1]